MLSTIIILFLIVAGLAIILIFDDFDEKVIIRILGSALIFASGVILGVCEFIYKPQAIDVYRNNTTLQITYQDSIPVDSIVVFK